MNNYSPLDDHTQPRPVEHTVYIVQTVDKAVGDKIIIALTLGTIICKWGSNNKALSWIAVDRLFRESPNLVWE